MMIVQGILRPCVNRLPRKNAAIEKAVQAINEAVAMTDGLKPLTLFEACLWSWIDLISFINPKQLSNINIIFEQHIKHKSIVHNKTISCWFGLGW